MAIFFIIILIVAIVLIFILSSLKVDIQNLEIINTKITKLKIVISIALLNKINLLKITIDKDKIKRIRYNEKIRKLNKKIEERLLNNYKNIRDVQLVHLKEYLKTLKNIEIKDVNIEARVGTESAPLTAFLVTLISIMITFLIAQKLRNTRYKILPIYKDKNYLNLSIKCIISIKLVHIINIIKQLKRKDRYKEYGRSFNRRTYANSNG